MTKNNKLFYIERLNTYAIYEIVKVTTSRNPKKY